MTTKLVITKKKRGEDGHKTLSIRVREDIIDRLDDLAGQTGALTQRANWTIAQFRAEQQ